MKFCNAIALIKEGQTLNLENNLFRLATGEEIMNDTGSITVNSRENNLRIYTRIESNTKIKNMQSFNDFSDAQVLCEKWEVVSPLDENNQEKEKVIFIVPRNALFKTKYTAFKIDGKDTKFNEQMYRIIRHDEIGEVTFLNDTRYSLLFEWMTANNFVVCEKRIWESRASLNGKQ